MAYVIGVLITTLVTLVIAACKVAGEADEIERGMHDDGASEVKRRDTEHFSD